MGRLVIVGCGTVVPEPDRGCSCYYVELGDSRILLDCGPGAVQGMARLGLPWGELTDLAITHFHPDHVGALPGLFFGFRHGLPYDPRTRPLDVWGPAGTRALFEALAAALGDFFLDPGFPVRIRELAPGDEARLEGGAVLTAHKTPHTGESLAYRLEAGDGSVGYTGDTGPSGSLGPFMSGVTVLVCECSLHDHEASENHLSPASAAAIARAAAPGTLILTHIYPHLRRGADPAALVAAAGFEGRIRLAAEGLSAGL